MYKVVTFFPLIIKRYKQNVKFLLHIKNVKRVYSLGLKYITHHMFFGFKFFRHFREEGEINFSHLATIVDWFLLPW